MKTAVKYYFSRMGILPHLDSIRRLPETQCWITGGCTGIAPPPVKRKILKAYLDRYGLNTFVETGTHLGDTLALIAHDKNTQCTSIELSQTYYELAQDRFRTYANVRLLQGDSGVLMSSILSQLSSPALFWLDGHYSGGATAKGAHHTPVSAELQAILASPLKNHVVLIDDARCFVGRDGYPHLDDLLKTVREQSTYSIEVSTDIIRLTPANNN